MDQIENLRTLIDSVDDQLFELIVSRTELVKEIGKLKQDKKLEIVDEKREEEIFNKIISKAKDKNLNPESIKKIWTALINISYEIERNKNENS